MLCSLSTKLAESDLQAITDLEKQVGHPLLAFSCNAIAPAQLQPGQLEKIQELESRLGVSLVAVDA